jgi:ribosomal protein S18 acetylase RimI-like enzyme
MSHRRLNGGANFPSMDTLPPIRDARPDEGAAYSQFARAIFIATYAAGNDPARLAVHVAAAFSQELQSAELADPARTTLVIDAAEGGWAAFATLKHGDPPAVVGHGRAIEVERFYVDTPYHGRAVAARLMDAVVARARSGGYDVLWLGVWTHNHRAIRFYEKVGFAVVGTYPFVFGGAPEDDLLMVRPL